MKREFVHQVMVNKTDSWRECDDCGKKLTPTWRYLHCNLCGKDLCRQCIGYDAPTMGDYEEVYCKTCFDIMQQYDARIDKLQKELDELYERRAEDCKEARKASKTNTG